MDFSKCNFPGRRKRSACTRVFRGYTRISNIKRTRKEREKREKKKRETIVKHLSFALAPRVPFEGAWILRGCVIRVEFFETLWKAEASKLKSKLSIPILEDNVTELCALFAFRIVELQYTYAISSPRESYESIKLSCFFLMQAIFNS